MIYDNGDGYVAHRRLRQQYEFEIECKAIDSDYSETIKSLLAQYRQISEKYDERSVLKESEDFSHDNPSYNFSLYCSKKELEDIKQELRDQNVHINQVLENFI